MILYLSHLNICLFLVKSATILTSKDDSWGMLRYDVYGEKQATKTFFSENLSHLLNNGQFDSYLQIDRSCFKNLVFIFSFVG